MDLITAVKATYEVIGQDISDLAIQAVVVELKAYPEEAALIALSRCRKELRRLTLADILDRLPGSHPGPEAAWSIVSRAISSEDVSLVWTDEMREAYGVARWLSKDLVAARMAFKEDYLARITQARANRQQPQWCLSLGHDAMGREGAVREAIQKGLITQDQAAGLLPDYSEVCVQTQAVIARICASATKQLSDRRKS